MTNSEIEKKTDRNIRKDSETRTYRNRNKKRREKKRAKIKDKNF